MDRDDDGAIVFLVSADLLASDLVALARSHRGDARVVPILVRSADLMSSPLAQLQTLLRDGRPVTSWPDQDEAWAQIVRALIEFSAERVPPPAPRGASRAPVHRRHLPDGRPAFPFPLPIRIRKSWVNAP